MNADKTKLLRELESREKPARLTASKELRDLSAEAPELLYGCFGRFAELLEHENNVLRWNAILTIGHLARADRDGKIEGLLERYLAPIRGPVMITAANTIKGAAMIARSKPALADEIVCGIMAVEKARYATPE